MSTSLKLRGIGALKHKSAQFAELSLFLPGKNNQEQEVYTSIRGKLYLIEGLRANILIGNNILTQRALYLMLVWAMPL